MKLYNLLGLFIILFPMAGNSQDNSTNTIIIEITDLRNNDGKVGVTLFGSEEGFPSDAEKALRKEYTDVKNLKAEIKFDNVPVGKYAIAVFHDEDENGELETNFIGIPREGTGSSNNPKPRMGPPRYEDCEFDSGETNRLTIIMKYY